MNRPTDAAIGPTAAEIAAHMAGSSGFGV
jgi:hypothetical protein